MDNKSGFIYLLKGDDYYKIGMTRNVDKRVSQISPKMPFECELIHVIETEDRVMAEAVLHDRFAPDRANGEWFELDDDSISWLLSIVSIEFRRDKTAVFLTKADRFVKNTADAFDSAIELEPDIYLRKNAAVEWAMNLFENYPERCQEVIDEFYVLMRHDWRVRFLGALIGSETRHQKLKKGEK